MPRHYIEDEDGEPTDLFWQDDDGDSPEHQKLYRKTRYGSERVDGCYDPDADEFHDA